MVQLTQPFRQNGTVGLNVRPPSSYEGFEAASAEEDERMNQLLRDATP